MRSVFLREPPLEFSILHNVKPMGCCVGYFAGRELSESVLDGSGRRFVYAGIAPRKWNGALDVAALAAGEFILQPGLIYRLASEERSWFGSLLRSPASGN